MKTRIFTVLTLASFLFVGSVSTSAQEAETVTAEVEKVSPIAIGTDLVSTYVWRGLRYSGPAIQPFVEASWGGFTMGTWGSFGMAPEFGSIEADGSFSNQVFSEVDLYAGYSFDFGLSLGLTGYFYPVVDANAGDYFGDNHALEINLGYEISNFSLSGNYVVNKNASAGADGSDAYFEAGYSFKYFDAFVGGGNGWHTWTDADNGDDVWGITNVGISTTKEITITDKFSLPMFAQVSVNPNHKQYYLVVGVSF